MLWDDWIGAFIHSWFDKPIHNSPNPKKKTYSWRRQIFRDDPVPIREKRRWCNPLDGHSKRAPTGSHPSTWSSTCLCKSPSRFRIRYLLRCSRSRSWGSRLAGNRKPLVVIVIVGWGFCWYLQLAFGQNLFASQSKKLFSLVGTHCFLTRDRLIDIPVVADFFKSFWTIHGWIQNQSWPTQNEWETRKSFNRGAMGLTCETKRIE